MRKMSISYIIARFLFNNTWLSYKIPDEQYIKILYKGYTGKKLRLKEPVSFNEKIQWLKLNYHHPDYAAMADKYKVKEYAKKKIGSRHVIPTLEVYESVEDIELDSLPNSFVIKCTHDSGSVILVRDKGSFDLKKAKALLKKSLSQNFFYPAREWAYKNIKPKIIVEKYMESESGEQIMDYKIFNFNGVPKIIQVDFDRFIDHKRNIYDLNWKLLDVTIQYPNDPSREIVRPEKLEQMLDFAKKLSAGIPLVRTDFYYIDNEIYLGEMTFYHGAGFEKISPEEFDITMGQFLKLPEKIVYRNV